jgi:hypothetical protein
MFTMRLSVKTCCFLYHVIALTPHDVFFSAIFTVGFVSPLAMENGESHPSGSVNTYLGPYKLICPVACKLLHVGHLSVMELSFISLHR